MTSSTEADRLFTTADGHPRLRGGRCPACDTHVFPRQGTCPRCGSELLDVALPDTGTVWAATVQRLAPKPPYRSAEAFEPFAVGYVDLGPVLVESTLAGKSPDAWEIGDVVQLAVAEGSEPPRFWFEAVAR